MKQQMQANKIEWREVEFPDCLIEEASSNKLKIPGKDFLESGKFPIVDQGETFIAGYTDDKSKVYTKKLPVIIFGDHTRILKFVNFSFALGADGVKILVPKEEINAKYLYFAIRNLKLKSLGYSRHYKLLKDKKIPLPFSDNKPNLSEQQRIASILEKAEKQKERGKNAEKLLDEYLKSVFNEMFLKEKFEVVSLKQACPILRKSILPEKLDKELYYVGLEHIESQTGIILQKLNAKSQNLKSNKFLFDKDCVLYGKLRPYLNKIALPDFEGVCSTDILPLKPEKNKANKYYIAYLLKTKSYVDRASSLCAGANLPRLSPKDLENFKIPLPPLPLQQKFSKIVKQVESMKENVKKTKQNSEELFDSLMKKAFRGEL